jgi:hypothetical protein
MTADPRAALASLVAALERHFEVAKSRRDPDDPGVVTAAEELTDAFFDYDEALFDVTGVTTPLDGPYDEDDDLEDLEDDDEDEDEDLDDEDDDDEDDDDEDDDEDDDLDDENDDDLEDDDLEDDVDEDDLDDDDELEGDILEGEVEGEVEGDAGTRAEGAGTGPVSR